MNLGAVADPSFALSHSMMGSVEDPKDGGKVATAVFGAVAVYGVSPGQALKRDSAIVKWEQS